MKICLKWLNQGKVYINVYFTILFTSLYVENIFIIKSIKKKGRGKKWPSLGHTVLGC